MLCACSATSEPKNDSVVSQNNSGAGWVNSPEDNGGNPCQPYTLVLSEDDGGISITVYTACSQASLPPFVGDPAPFNNSPDPANKIKQGNAK